MLKSSCYQTRCSVANILEEITNEQNYYPIYVALFSQLKRKQTIAVSSTIESTLEEIKKRFPDIKH